MAKRAVSQDKVRVDPLFNIPRGAEENFVFSRENTDEDYVADNDDILQFETYDDFDESFEDDLEGDEDDELESEELATPEILGIISQTLRRAPGGQQVVDVVLEVEDVDGAMNYEVQVTKI